MKFFSIQNESFTDMITDDGIVGTKMPYPFVVGESGYVEGQDFWKGDPFRVVGFQKDLAVKQIDLYWDEVIKDPKKAEGTYLVTRDRDGAIGVHLTAVMHVKEIVRQQ